MLKARADLVFELPEEAWFDLDFMHKDIELALEAARKLGVAVPSATAAEGVLRAALDLGYGRRDIAALFQVLGRLSDDRARSPA
jgi:3-hydroxyisobutyrate dehydrogenase-like beta-hydroxyacid dehydrogenase